MKQKEMQVNKENRTINQLAGYPIEKSSAGHGYLVNRVEELCNVPISRLDVEDHRILINQGIALKYILPSAIEILSRNLFAEGDYFEGDLLKSVLTIDESFWKENSTLKDEVREICLKEFSKIDGLDLSESIKEDMKTLVSSFLE